MTHRIGLLFLIISFISSCISDTEKQENTKDFVLKGKARFPLDNYTSYKTKFICLEKSKEGEELLYFLNENKPSIIIYKVFGREFHKEILLDENGPDGVGIPSGLLVKNPDSIYVVSSRKYMVSLVNSSGEKLRNYAMLKSGEKYSENTGMIRPYTISPPHLIGNDIYFNVAPDRDVYSAEYFDGHTNVKLNLVDGNVTYFNNYPQEFREEVWGVNSTDFSTTYSNNAFIYSFAISDSLVVYHLETNKRKRYLANSKFDDSQIKPMLQKGFEFDLEYVLTTRQYAGITYDPYRDIYYRFVKHKISYKDENGQINSFHSKPISVIILDADFNVIGESMLKNDTYTSSMYFVGEEGIFISTANPLNNEIDENYAEFDVFLFE